MSAISLLVSEVAMSQASLESQLSQVTEGFKKMAPQGVLDMVLRSVKDLQDTFDHTSTIQIGDSFPAFNLTDANGQTVTDQQLLNDGPFLITFYRGEWCPYCNLALASLQKHLDDFKSKGVRLIAVSPELPNHSLSSVEKFALKFTVLSDTGNGLARKLGIVWKQPDTLRPLFDQFNHNLVKYNGDDTFEVPIPATFLVDQKGIVRNMFLDTDYKKRLDPTVALKWIDML